MNRESWNSRYGEVTAVYGDEPNAYFRHFIDSHPPGSILLPAEGEGRNAIYAASKGWKVTAFDFSEVAYARTLEKAAAQGLDIRYHLMDARDFRADEIYDAAGLIHVHLPPAARRAFHRQVHKSLRSGGYLVLEAFAKEQIRYQSGGPRDEELLYSIPDICNDFQFSHLISCGQKEVILDEGEFHRGKAAVLQLLAQKL